MLTLKLGSPALNIESCEEGEHLGLDPSLLDSAALVPLPQVPEKLGSTGALGLSSAQPLRAPPSVSILPARHAIFPHSACLSLKPRRLVEFRPQLCCEAPAGPFPGLVLGGCQAPWYSQGDSGPQARPASSLSFLAPPSPAIGPQPYE